MSSMTEFPRKDSVYGNHGMEQLISVVNNLQDAFTSLGLPLTLDLPQIAVVGSQSAGKSSVLENVVGRDFLPRGSGIVTRRPLVLQLIQHPTEYAEFLHIRGKQFFDFNEVRKEIDSETDRLLGAKKTVSNVPINLRIYSPNVLNLTLIDLPGLTKNPIGEQPRDIVEQIRKMVLDYISRENCLILAVSPANTDLANSDALQIAREVDPQGLRTVGVITKLDLMDQGTNARDVLENKVLPLRRGYIGVVNRSQKDIESNKDIRSTIEAERKFFTDHPAYRHLADRCGTPYLQQALNRQLTEHIRERLPGLRKELQDKLTKMEREVTDFGPADEKSRRRKAAQLLHDFSDEFRNSIFGSGSESLNDALIAGALINIIFNTKFPAELSRLSMDKAKLAKEISFAIWNNEAIRTSLFTPHSAFEAVIRAQIERILEPCHRCVDMVLKEVFGAIGKSATQMKQYPKLQMECERIAMQKARECEQACKQQVKMMVDMQWAYININHKDFIGFLKASQDAEQTAQTKQQQQPLQQQRPVASNQVLIKSWLTLQNSSFLKSTFKETAWFVLTTDALTWYADDQEKNKKFQLPISGIRYRDLQSNSKFMFTLYSADGRNVYGEFKHLELICGDGDTKTAWRDAFQRLGANTADPTAPSNNPFDPPWEEVIAGCLVDPDHRKRVLVIGKCVESYMEIVHKTTFDMIPKAIVLIIINELKLFFTADFRIAVQESEDDLMAVGQEEAVYRENILKTYNATKKALSIISEIYGSGALSLRKT